MTASEIVTHPPELNTGVWTSWLPLTIPWPSQAACDSAIWIRGSINETEYSFPYIFDPAYGQSVANLVTCLPPYATQWWDGPVTVTNTVTSWSIGPIVCPAAYSTASTSVVGSSSTSVMCCPRNYDYVRNVPNNPGLNNGVCTSTFTSGQVLTFASPVGNSFPATTTTFTDDSNVLLAVPVEGYNFAASTTGSITTTTSRLSARTSRSPTSSPTSSPTHTSTPSSGLSPGASAGIGIGVALVALLLGGIVFWLLRRRRKYQPNAINELPTYREAKGARIVKAGSGSELPAEVDGSPRLQELQA